MPSLLELFPQIKPGQHAGVEETLEELTKDSQAQATAPETTEKVEQSGDTEGGQKGKEEEDVTEGDAVELQKSTGSNEENVQTGSVFAETRDSAAGALQREDKQDALPHQDATEGQPQQESQQERPPPTEGSISESASHMEDVEVSATSRTEITPKRSVTPRQELQERLAKADSTGKVMFKGDARGSCCAIL